MKKGLLLFSLLIVVACESTEQKNTQSWHGSMRSLASTLNKIMPELITQPYRRHPIEKKNLLRTVAELEALGDDLSIESPAIPSRDPSLKFIAQDFKEKISSIKKNSKSQSLDATHKEIRDLTRYCIACHTRIQARSSYFSKDMGDNFADYDHYSKASFFAAVRQFEKAMIHYEKSLTDKTWGEQHPQEWEQAAMRLLTITVKVQVNPNLTTEMLSRLFDTNSFPKSLYKAARVWKSDSQAWEAEKNSKESLDKVGALIEKAKQREAKLQYSGLLLNLRASKILNEQLRSGRTNSNKLQTLLYYTGLTEKRLEKLTFSGFPKSYFQACVSLGSETKMGKKCQENSRLGSREFLVPLSNGENIDRSIIKTHCYLNQMKIIPCEASFHKHGGHYF